MTKTEQFLKAKEQAPKMAELLGLDGNAQIIICIKNMELEEIKALAANEAIELKEPTGKYENVFYFYYIIGVVCIRVESIPFNVTTSYKPIFEPLT